MTHRLVADVSRGESGPSVDPNATMELVLVIVAAAAAAWGAVIARCAPLWLGAAGCIALGYVLGPPLWTAHVGPLPLTPDRIFAKLNPVAGHGAK